MTLDKKQRGIVLVAALAIMSALLFPPWVYTYDRNGNAGGHSVKAAEYSCIFFPPEPPQNVFGSYSEFLSVRIDGTRLLIELACIGLAAGMVFALGKPPK